MPLRFVEENNEELLMADTLDYLENKTEIQLKNIFDRMGAASDTKTDGDETAVKDGDETSPL